MKKIHGTTVKIAAKLNIDLTAHENLLDDGNDLLCFFCSDEEIDGNEHGQLADYIINPNGTYTFRSCYYPSEISELPATIFNEKQLREVIKFIGSEIPAVRKHWA